MGVFDLFEKLINEHGSAAILREHLGLLKAEQAALERKCADLDAKSKALESENEQLRADKLAIQDQMRILQSGTHTGYVCDHCGSALLKRTGNRPDPTFGQLGVKQGLFTCLVCAKESAFTLEP
jgi:FtsZ-binding cell division protein ZapB